MKASILICSCLNSRTWWISNVHHFHHQNCWIIQILIFFHHQNHRIPWDPTESTISLLFQHQIQRIREIRTKPKIPHFFHPQNQRTRGIRIKAAICHNFYFKLRFNEFKCKFNINTTTKKKSVCNKNSKKVVNIIELDECNASKIHSFYKYFTNFLTKNEET